MLVTHELLRRDLIGAMARSKVLLQNRLDVFVEADDRRLRIATTPRTNSRDGRSKVWKPARSLGPVVVSTKLMIPRQPRQGLFQGRHQFVGARTIRPTLTRVVRQ